jgi:hypothetical protein
VGVSGQPAEAPHHRFDQMPLPIIGGLLLADTARAIGAVPHHAVFRDDDGMHAWVTTKTACDHVAHLHFRLEGC